MVATSRQGETATAEGGQRAGDFVPVPLKDIWGADRARLAGDGACLRLYPHLHDTDGFFASILRRVR